MSLLCVLCIIAKYFVRVDDAVCWNNQEKVKTLIDFYRMNE